MCVHWKCRRKTSSPFCFASEFNKHTSASRKALDTCEYNDFPSWRADGIGEWKDGEARDKAGKFVSANLDFGATRRSYNCDLRTPSEKLFPLSSLHVQKRTDENSFLHPF